MTETTNMMRVLHLGTIAKCFQSLIFKQMYTKPPTNTEMTAISPSGPKHYSYRIALKRNHHKCCHFTTTGPLTVSTRIVYVSSLLTISASSSSSNISSIQSVRSSRYTPTERHGQCLLLLFSVFINTKTYRKTTNATQRNVRRLDGREGPSREHGSSSSLGRAKNPQHDTDWRLPLGAHVLAGALACCSLRFFPPTTFALSRAIPAEWSYGYN